jgi:uncharacterized membrane protein YgdD (TMEM256/DUF423 family)
MDAVIVAGKGCLWSSLVSGLVWSLVCIGYENLKTTPWLIQFLLNHALILLFVSRTGSRYSRHGKMSGWAVVLSVFCFVSSFFAARASSFVRIQGILSNESPYGDRGASYGAGLFRFYRGNGGDGFFSLKDMVPKSSGYSRDLIDNASYFDGAFKASRAFNIMANICIVIGMICFVGSCCVELKPKTIKYLGYLFAVASIFHLLTFSLYASSLCEEFQPCRFGGGSFCAILAMILALVTAVLAFRIEARALPKPKTVTEPVMADGTKKITEITLNVDGSQTVTETVIRPEKV